MKKSRHAKTAEDFMRELERDPEYLLRRAERDEKFRKVRERLGVLQEPFLARLEKAGYPANSISDVTSIYAPLPGVVINILLDCLQDCADERLQESIVRALGAAELPFDGTPLCQLFEATSSEALRFAILNTIALSRPHSIDDWMNKIRVNEFRSQQLADLGYTWPQA